MRKNLTEIVFILDHSGSMSGLEADTIGGFSSMIEKQKKENGEALISTPFSVFMASQQRQDYDVPMGTSLTPLRTLTAEVFFLSTLTAISKARFGQFSENCFSGRKRTVCIANRS